MKINGWSIALTWLVATGLLLDAPHTKASDFQSPRTAALGGAGHAGPLLNDAIYQNSSYMAFLPTYAVSGNYAWAQYQDGSYHYKIQNLSIQDGRSDLFQAGIGYSRRDDGNIFHLGTGKAIIPQRLSVGLGGKMFLPAGNGNVSKVVDADFSSTGIVYEWLQASFTADNLVESDTSKQYGFYREFTVGTKINVEKIMLLYIDPHFAPDVTSSSHFGYEMGVEWPMFTDMFLRGGYFRSSAIPTLGNENRGRGFGMGFGFIAPRISIDYGISRVLEPTIGTVQVIGFTMYLS